MQLIPVFLPMKNNKGESEQTNLLTQHLQQKNPLSQNSVSSSHMFSVSPFPECCVSVMLVESPRTVTRFHLKEAAGNGADLTENGEDGGNSTIRKGDKAHGTLRTCIVSLFQPVTYNLCLNNHRSPASSSNWIQSRLGTDEAVTHIASQI